MGLERQIVFIGNIVQGKKPREQVRFDLKFNNEESSFAELDYTNIVYQAVKIKPTNKKQTKQEKKDVSEQDRNLHNNYYGFWMMEYDPEKGLYLPASVDVKNSLNINYKMKDDIIERAKLIIRVGPTEVSYEDHKLVDRILDRAKNLPLKDSHGRNIS